MVQEPFSQVLRKMIGQVQSKFSDILGRRFSKFKPIVSQSSVFAFPLTIRYSFLLVMMVFYAFSILKIKILKARKIKTTFKFTFQKRSLFLKQNVINI